MIAEEPPRPTPNGMSELVLDGEVATRQVDAAVPAVAVQADDERLDQADAAVVPEAAAVADQRLRVVEGRAVAVARHHRQAR